MFQGRENAAGLIIEVMDPDPLGHRLIDGLAGVEGTGGILQNQLDVSPVSAQGPSR